jgi:hypothetical protein
MSLSLPEELISAVLAQWLTILDAARLDSALLIRVASHDGGAVSAAERAGRRWLPAVSDCFLALLALCCSKLKMLSIVKCAVTGARVAAVVRCCPDLNALGVEDCCGLTQELVEGGTRRNGWNCVVMRKCLRSDVYLLGSISDANIVPRGSAEGVSSQQGVSGSRS